ncbi:MAG: histidine kinase dimerization/phospho-acceptor domain-containing protein, partial [Pseudomonadota bacterium]
MHEFDGYLSALPHPTLVVSAAGHVINGNENGWQIVGPAARGRHYVTAFRQPPLLDAIEVCLAQKERRIARYMGRSLTGDTTFEVHINPAIYANTLQAVLTFVDVSAAEEISQMRRDFVANVSHELRTPLTAISGFIDTLAGPAKDDAAASQRFLDLMRTEADRMDHLIRDLLSLSRVEAEQKVRPTDVVDIAT